ncbi:MAG: hypothetical protein WC208_09890 [Gallionella sp.]
MKAFRKSDLQLPHLLLVMGDVARLMNRNGAQCAVLPGQTKSDVAKDPVLEVRRVG